MKGVDGSAGLPEDLELHHIVVNDWQPAVDSEQNVVLISIPSVKDSDLAPAGKHTLHAYLPATEPFSIWEGLPPPPGPAWTAHVLVSLSIHSIDGGERVFCFCIPADLGPAVWPPGCCSDGEPGLHKMLLRRVCVVTC